MLKYNNKNNHFKLYLITAINLSIILFKIFFKLFLINVELAQKIAEN